MTSTHADTPVLEICVDSYESVEACVAGGGMRMEMCAGLVVGGLSPSYALFEKSRAFTEVPINVLIRPRAGDFCYTEAEFDIMLREVRAFKDMGAAGVVPGALLPDGTLDQHRIEQLRTASEGMQLTLSRAFDVARDPFEALETAIDLGVDTILTSGQHPNAALGADLLGELNERAAGRIEILAGGGVNADLIAQLWSKGLRNFHMSGKIDAESLMEFRRPDVRMGAPGTDEFSIIRTDAEKVRAARRTVDRLALEETV